MSSDIQSNEQKQHALHRNELISRRIFESAPDAIIVVDLKGEILLANDSTVRMFGYEKGELIGQPVEILMPERFRKSHMGYRQHCNLKLYEKAKGTRRDIYAMHKNGSEFPVDVMLSPMKAPDEQAVIAIIRDVSVQTQAKELARKINRALEALSECNHALVRATDESQLISEVCRVIVEVSGYRLAWVGIAEQDKGKTVKPVGQYGYEEGYLGTVGITWADTERGRGPTGTVIRTGKPSIVQHMLTDPRYKPWSADATKRGYASSIALPLIINQRCIGALNVYADEPNAFDAEEVELLVQLGSDLSYGIMALRIKNEQEKAEQKYRTLFEEGFAGVYTSTPEGTLLACNDTFVHIFGFACMEEALGTNLAELYPRAEQRQEFLYRLKENRKLKNHECELRRRDGEQLYIIENVVGRFDDEGKLTEIQGHIFDNTERKQLEQQLFQAQKMESLGTLASGITHDFNNILGIILGHTSILERAQASPDTIANSVDAISKAVQRGANLVRQILTFARKADVTLEPVDVNSMIRELAKMLKETFPKIIEIELKLDETIPIVTMDHTQLHQTLLNLCVNARDAVTDLSPMESSHGLLTIRTERVSGSLLLKKFEDAKGSQYVCISVSDTGKGMDEATRRKIFEPFFTTKEPGKGTGLGLAVVYGVVKAHEGFIDFESEIGVGTTFKLYMPLRESFVDQVRPIETSGVDVKGGTETILFVEDEEGLLALMKSLLEDNGYRVLTARDGIEAIKIYAQHKDEIGLVFTDMGLPKLDGTAVFSTIIEMNSTAKFILATGYLETYLKSELFKAGAKEFLQKPYAPDEAIRKIREVLDNTV